MKIEICAVCQKMIGEVADDAAGGHGYRAACPECGAVTRVFEDTGNIARCRRCNEAVIPVDFNFLNSGGLCSKCTGGRG